jgi:hypothetical protein
MSALKIRRICLLSFSFLLLLGCNKGCSYSNEIDSESKTVSIDGIDFKIEASLIESGNTRRSNQDYSVSIGIADGADKIKEALLFPGVEYEVDLHQKIEPANIRGSKDKFTYQLTYDGHVCATYHNLDGKIISSPYGNNYNSQETNEVNSNLKLELFIAFQSFGNIDYTALPLEDEVDIDAYPSRNDLLKDVVLKKEIAGLFNSRDSRYVSSFLDEVNLSNEELSTFFERWPTDELAINYFSNEKIISLKAQNPSWYKMARNHLKDSYKISFRSSEVHDLIFNHLKDEELISSIDSAYVEKELSRTLSWSNDDYLLRRLEDSSPLSPNLQTKIEHICTKGIKDFPVKWPDQPLAELNVSITYFAKTNNAKMVKLAADQLLKELPTGGDWKADGQIRDLLKGANECISLFEQSDQKLIADHYFKNLEFFSENQQEEVLELCDGIISCNVLAPAIKEYNQKVHEDNDFFYYKSETCK